MSTIDPFRALVEEWDDREKALTSERASWVESIAILQARVRELELQLAHFEDENEPAEPPPVEPPPREGTLAIVSLTTPPLLINRGSWSAADYERSHVLVAGKLQIRLGQARQSEPRRLRHDFGLQNPALAPGRGGMLREPTGRLRRYEVRIGVPEQYDSAGGMCNLLQFHTHTAKLSPYLVFMLRTSNAYVRHIWPDGTRHDEDLGPIEAGHEYALQVDAIWRGAGAGVLRAWVDGAQVVTYLGPTIRADEDQGPYLLLGPDYPSAKEAFKATFTFSELRIGDV